MSSTVNSDAIAAAISGILKEYGQVVFKATDAGLDAGAKTAINVLKAASPIASGEYMESWSKRKNGTLRRMVGNRRKAPSKRRGDIPLINILEYAGKPKGRPHVNKTIQANKDMIARAVIEEIEKKV